MIPLRVVTIDDEHPDLTLREMARCSKAGHQAVGEKYAKDLLPEHFEIGARAAFGYGPRTEKWLRRKQRLFEAGAIVGGRRVIAGRNQDLVFTGLLREQVVSSARQNIRAYPSRVTITMRVDRQEVPYFTFRGRTDRTRRMAREILTDSPRHLRIMEETFDRGFEQELSRLRRSRRLSKTTRAA